MTGADFRCFDSREMRCSYQPIASASSVREVIMRAKVRISDDNSAAGSWYCSVAISVFFQVPANFLNQYRSGPNPQVRKMARGDSPRATSYHASVLKLRQSLKLVLGRIVHGMIRIPVFIGAAGRGRRRRTRRCSRGAV
jgi:hypothetical protein